MGERPDLTGAFEVLFGLLGRGVPPEERHLPPVLVPIVLDYYAETCRTLEIFQANLRLSEVLLRRHPEDHRLACLYATGGAREPRTRYYRAHRGPRDRRGGALVVACRAGAVRGVRGPLAFGGGTGPGARAPLTPLAREEQRQCVLALTRRRLRAVSTPEACRTAVEGLAAYLAAAYEALSHGAALERELVFVGSLTAAWRGVPLPVLSYAAFVQLVGYAADLCRELPPAEGLVIEFLERHPERWLRAPMAGNAWRPCPRPFPRAVPQAPAGPETPARPAPAAPTLGGAAHQRLLRRLGIPVQRRRSPGGSTRSESADGPRRSNPPKNDRER